MGLGLKGAVVALLLLPLVVPSPPGAAVGPLDDDAGSGQDAGDVKPLAVPIVPGTYTGTLTYPSDTTDLYSFHAENGSLIETSLGDTGRDVYLAVTSPSGRTMDLVRDGDDGVVVATETGTWYIEVIENIVTLHDAGPHTYAFTFVMAPGTHAEGRTSREAWAVAEAAWDQPMDVVIMDRTEYPATLTSPLRGVLFWEYFAKIDGIAQGGAGIYSLGHDAPGNTLGSDGISSGPLVPRIVEFEGGGATWFTLEFPRSEFGRVRVGGYYAGDTETAPRFDTGAWATGPFDHAAAHGSQIVFWTAESPGEHDHVVAPGATVLGPQSRTYALDRDFFGIFSPHDGGGTIWYPDGSGSLNVPPGYAAFFRHPFPGSWQFDVGERTAVGTNASVIFLSGAFIPDLGVFSG